MRRIRGGLFVALEGGDGTGKTTQLNLLEARMRELGVDYDRTREPGGTQIGENIRSLVLEHGQGEVDPRTEALLFAASRAAHVTQRILPALHAGKVVLSDRYVDSSVAYQGAGRGLGTAEVARINQWATSGLHPDLTVVLDMEPEDSDIRRAQRDGGTADRMESADGSFRNTLRAAFLAQARSAPSRYLVVNADQPAKAVHAEIAARVDELIQQEPRA